MKRSDPNWRELHDLGREIGRQLPWMTPWHVIAAKMGMKVSTVQYVANSALGKVAWRARKIINNEKA